MKKCCTCNTNKDESEFHKGARRCKPCAVAYAKEWAEKNPEKVKQAQLKHRNANKEGNKLRLDEWRKANPEKVQAQWDRANEKSKERRKPNLRKPSSKEDMARMAKARNRRYADKHPDRVAFNLSNRRAAKAKAMPLWANKFFMAEAYRLAKLRTQLTCFAWHVDHIVPLRSPVVCGLHCEANLQVIPAAENYRKSNKFQS